MMPSSLSCGSKVVLITDAGIEIGEATARHLASLGHKLMLGSSRVDRIAALARDITRTGGTASYQELDATSRGSVRAFLLLAEACFGRPDVLVNTAGTGNGIVAALPIVEAQGGQIIHVPTDHPLQARAVARSIGVAISKAADADINVWIDRTATPGLRT
ncbi:SDR family NAD(P)-dependent oxidoreductase [Tardiphaga sp.]|uniref:SDR family oxidoreductase n=1 Tax=Tardiphaga sp. TaxID=1926292 RepID=UPI00260B139A|nr:SDR family NAD(P)-dependent oxidoreductase [Tardiphaga sp.]MDB5620495.1 oxidoreductase [Tardiphaga sp.]